LLFVSGVFFSQNSDAPITIKKDKVVVTDTTTTKEEYDPLAPSRAAFYSAVIPGLGQAYNKKFWKIPLVYAGIGTGIYFYTENNKDFNRFRDAFKRRLAGFEDDEFQGITTERLEDAQRTASRNRDVSIIVAIAFYVLNIIDANVDAHLRQFNINSDLSISPDFNINTTIAQPSYGVSFRFNLQ